MKYLDNLDIDLDQKMLILNHLFQFFYYMGKIIIICIILSNDYKQFCRKFLIFLFIFSLIF
jgi:hypothetical protein